MSSASDGGALSVTGAGFCNLFGVELVASFSEESLLSVGMDWSVAVLSERSFEFDLGEPSLDSSSDPDPRGRLGRLGGLSLTGD